MSQAVELLKLMQEWREDPSSVQLARQVSDAMRRQSDAAFILQLPYRRGVAQTMWQLLRRALAETEPQQILMWLEVACFLLKVAETPPKLSKRTGRRPQQIDIKKRAAGDDS